MYNSFDSIDRLMEFGLSMAVATQMVNTMNNVMSDMTFAGQNSSINNLSKQEEYYIVFDGKMCGPMSENELITLVKNGSITKDTLCWYAQLTGWRCAKEIPQILKLILLNS